jgi:citrate synthase
VSELPRLTSAQAAARLGIKPSSLYSYVSRGLIASRRAEKGGSTFDAFEIEALALHRRRERSPYRAETAGRRMPGEPLMVLDSAITLLADDELYFRGEKATTMAASLTFEAAVEKLWESAPVPGDDLPHAILPNVLGRSAHLVDRLALAVLLAGSADPMKDELSAGMVHRAGRRMIAAMVDAVGDGDRESTASASVADRLWRALGGSEPAGIDLAILNSALVLCMDHDLAASTLAARVAASARAHPYAAIGSALGAFDGGLHGSASIPARQLIVETMQTGDPERAIAEALRRTSVIPGFGHRIYRHHDPRARFLITRMRKTPRYEAVVTAVDSLEAVMAARAPRPANLDLALAAVTVAAGFEPDAGQAIFAIGRTAGWIAHIVDEYAQPALRLRPEGRYIGRAPLGSPRG